MGNVGGLLASGVRDGACKLGGMYRPIYGLSSSGRSIQTSARAFREGCAKKSRYWTRFYDVLSLAISFT